MLSAFTFTNLSPVHKVHYQGLDYQTSIGKGKDVLYICNDGVITSAESGTVSGPLPPLTCFTKIVSMGSSLFRGLPGNNKAAESQVAPNHNKPAPGRSERSQDWATINMGTSFSKWTFNPLRVQNAGLSLEVTQHSMWHPWGSSYTWLHPDIICQNTDLTLVNN